MEEINQIPEQQPKKKIGDITLTFLGLAALILVLLLLKYLMQKFNLIG